MEAGFASILDGIQQQVRQQPDGIAVKAGNRALSYAQLDLAANRCANALLAAGVVPGCRVAYLGKNDPSFFIYWLGALKAQACLVPLNWRLAPPELAYLLTDSCTRILVCSADFLPVIDRIAPDCPDLTTVVQIDPGGSAWPQFDAWLAAQDPWLDSQHAGTGEDILQVYTSGTTGMPKGVRLSEENLMARFDSARVLEGDYSHGDILLAVMPLFHVAGITPCLSALLQGTCILLPAEFHPGECIRLIGEHHVTHTVLAPVMIRMILEMPQARSADFSSLKCITYGAAPMSEAVLLAARQVFNCAFRQTYGLTETTAGGCRLSESDHDPALGKLLSCGRPMPGYDIRVRLHDRIAAPMEIGEVEIRSKGVMKGYWNQPQATAEAIDQDGWFRTGDAGYVDTDGYLYLHDRLKDMIVSGGENVYPAEVENALCSHPAIADAAVIGIPDPQWGEVVAAFLVFKPGAAADAAGIIAHCRKLIGGYKTPRLVAIMNAIPRNASGKILRRELKKQYWQGQPRLIG